jgi:hypothetical protein
MLDYAGKMSSLPAVFPDRTGPGVRAAPKGQRELLMMRWGLSHEHEGQLAPSFSRQDTLRQ